MLDQMQEKTERKRNAIRAVALHLYRRFLGGESVQTGHPGLSIPEDRVGQRIRAATLFCERQKAQENPMAPGGPAGAGPDYRHWELPETGVSIRLSLEAMDRLEREALESLRSIASRGSEIGGLLLGQVSCDPRAIEITDYELVGLRLQPRSVVPALGGGREAVGGRRRPAAGVAVGGRVLPQQHAEGAGSRRQRCRVDREILPQPGLARPAGEAVLDEAEFGRLLPARRWAGPPVDRIRVPAESARHLFSRSGGAGSRAGFRGGD